MHILFTPAAQRAGCPPTRAAPRDWTNHYPDGEPCGPAVNPWWPGMPRWLELETARLAAMEADGWVDCDPPSDAQARYIRHLGGVVPSSAAEARKLITRLKRERI